MGINFKTEVSQQAGNSTFDPLPEGRYIVKVEDANAKTSKTGKEMIEVTFSVTDGPHRNRKVWTNFITEGSSLPYLYRALKAMECTVADKDDVEIADIIKDMVGKSCSVFVEVRVDENSGRSSNTIKNYSPATESQASIFANAAERPAKKGMFE